MRFKQLKTASWMLTLCLCATVSQAAILQTGAGGTTNPTGWTSGILSDVIPAMTVVPANFGSLFDGGTNTVGGGTVSGDLYYAFTARSLDRAGDTRLPAGSVAKQPYSPSNAFSAGQLMVGAAPSLGISQAYGYYALSYFNTLDGSSGHDLGPTRYDIAPQRVVLFQVHIKFNASANDQATVTMSIYDNLPGQRQPIAIDMPTYTQTHASTLSGDFSFDAFRFVSGVGSDTPAKWAFSDVVFSDTDGEAAARLLAVPEPASFGAFVAGGLLMGLRRRRH